MEKLDQARDQPYHLLLAKHIHVVDLEPDYIIEGGDRLRRCSSNSLLLLLLGKLLFPYRDHLIEISAAYLEEQVKMVKLCDASVGAVLRGSHIVEERRLEGKIVDQSQHKLVFNLGCTAWWISL